MNAQSFDVVQTDSSKFAEIIVPGVIIGLVPEVKCFTQIKTLKLTF